MMRRNMRREEEVGAMRIKQQGQIYAFLTGECGEEKGKAVFAKQEEILRVLIEQAGERSKSQKKTLVQTILPRIALYQALAKENMAAAEIVRRYMMDVVAAKKHASTARMEMVPGFYALYSRIFLKIMRGTDLQESVQSQGKGYFDVTITRCLWHTACVENGCTELCRLFCDVDEVTYGGLRKIGFTRTQTLGYGGDCCDFHFFKK